MTEPPRAPVAAESSAADDSAAVTRHARAALDQADALCTRIRREAGGRADQLSKVTLGDLARQTERWVRRHPVAGVAIAAAVGFWLGRHTRR